MKNIIVVMMLLLGTIGCDRVEKSDKIVVIDAGHGGDDIGAAFDGKLEKNLVLAISQKVRDNLESRGYKVYLTRDSDRTLKLGERTWIADHKNAKVFISIHANAIAQKHMQNRIEGVETYFLQKTRDAKSQRVAARENASLLMGADKLSKHVIIDSVLNGPKIIESHKLAIDVQNSIIKNIKYDYSGVKNGGVRPAPFWILVGASRPSILVEVGYITNNKERNRLFTSSYQNRIAVGITDGVDSYFKNRSNELGF